MDAQRQCRQGKINQGIPDTAFFATAESTSGLPGVPFWPEMSVRMQLSCNSQ
jgi:hypothetical protein